MEQKDKPRLAEVLGVEEDKTWRYPGCFGLYRIHSGVREYWDDNNEWLACDCEEDLIKIIAHPEAIIRASFLTEPELAICKVVGAKWVSRDNNPDAYPEFWEQKPELTGKAYNGPYGSRVGIFFRKNAFPSVHPGDLIPVDPEKQ